MITDNQGRTLFTEEELRCKGSGLLILADGFAGELRGLRVALNEPMHVASCCRSKAHNDSEDVNGHPRSLHVCDDPYWPTGGTAAIDIHTPDAAYRARLVSLALQLGWSVGIHPTFTHLDRRSDYTHRPQAVFLY